MPKKEVMTPRERVNRALNFEIPDRVPIDLGGKQTGIHKNAYRALLKELGIADEVVIMDAVQQLARPSEEVLQRFHVDARCIAAGAASSWKGGIVKARRDGAELGRLDGRVWHPVVDARRRAVLHGYHASSTRYGDAK
jgi:uroporphyrinogen decarboxylase